MDNSLFNHPELYKVLCDINDTKDYRVYYHKAAYEYLYLDKKEESLKNISIAIERFEKYGTQCDMSLCVEILNQLDNILIKTNINHYLSKMYLLAAELQGEIRDKEKSKDLYLKYYYYCNIVGIANEIRDKESVIVYSFRKYSEYSLQDLINGTITCIHPSKMNDPFDSIANYISKPSRLSKNCNKENHIMPQSECFKHFTIRAFSANRLTYSEDDIILFDKKMWSHYAYYHEGFCIIYVFKKIFFNKYNYNNYSFTRLIPVNYDIDHPITICEKLNTDNSFAMKDKCWKDENEVRLLHFEKDNADDHQFIKLGNDAYIKEIVFGIRCPKDAKMTIANLYQKKCKLSEIYNEEDKDIYSLKKRDYKG